MNGKHYIGRRVSRFESHGATEPVTGVSLVVDEENEYFAGDRTGRVMEIQCPYGTQAMAEDLLASLGGRSYVGYRAENAVTDPAAELGDGVTVGGVYAPLVSRRAAFGAGHLTEISAPGEGDLEHEYGTESFAQTVERKLAQTRSTIAKTAEQIRLSVENEMDGRFSALDVTLESISGTVQGLDGRVGKVELTASGLTSRIEGVSGSVSAIEQRVDDIKLSVTGSLGGQASIELSGGGGGSGSIDLSEVRQAFADDESAVTISGGKVTFNSNTFVVNSTNFAVTADGTITAKAGYIGDSSSGWNIGYRSLYNGPKSLGSAVVGTYIGTDGIWQYGNNGSVRISNGQIVAKEAELEAISVYSRNRNIYPYSLIGDDAAAFFGNLRLMQMGDGYSCSLFGHTGEGTVELLYASTNYNGGKASAVLGYNCATRINGTEISIEHGPTYGSDRDIKKDIAPLPEVYMRLLDEMRPVIYRYDDEPDDGPIHVGYIAQEMEEAIGRAGLTRADVAALVGQDGTGQMGIGYDELIPILQMKLNALEARIVRLEKGM